MPYREFDNGIFEPNVALGTIYDASDPFRLRLQKCLSTALGQIVVEVPAKHPPTDRVGEIHLRDRVHRGRKFFAKETPLPFVSILEGLDSPNIEFIIPGSEGGSIPYILIVEGFVKERDLKHPTDAGHRLMAEVKRRLFHLKQDEKGGSGVFRFGHKANTCEAIDWESGVVRPEDETSATTHFWLHVTLKIIEDHENPLCE